MIKIKIAKQQFNCKTDWSDLTVNDCILLTSLKLPDLVVQAMEDKREVGLSDFMAMDGLRYVKDVFQLMTGCHGQVADKIHVGDMLVYFKKWAQIIFDLYNIIPTSYQPTLIKSFDFEGETYYLPESKTFQEVFFMPAVNTDSVTFVESANLVASMYELKHEGIKKMPLLIAAYCKKNGEQFDQFTVMERADRFKSLSMHIAWEVFFCIQNFSVSLLNDMTDFLDRITKAENPTTVKEILSGYSRRGYTRRLRKIMSVGRN